MAAPDGNRLASKFWIIALFDRRIKGVHVDMDDLPWRPLIVHSPGSLAWHCRGVMLKGRANPLIKGLNRTAMNIHEYQAKDLLAKFGVPVPAGHAAMTVEDAVRAAKMLPGPLWWW
jgi:hypothetical protein